jgi:4-hydroxy-tetrahydrodipicolinate reductase
MIKTIISGIFGRMGKEVALLIQEDTEVSLVGGFDGKEGTAPVSVSSRAADLPDFDVAIDFSAPGAVLEMVQLCAKRGKPLVSGTTGFTEKEMVEIEDAAKTIPVFLASNMSMGINTVLAILAGMPKAVYDGFDVEIVETHHRMKKDSRSGTAKTIAAMIAKKSGKASWVHGREGRGLERKDDEIGVHSVRGGTVVGTHSIFFHGNDESIEITHRAYSRKIFAIGALMAAKWIVKQEPGLYAMKDLIT